MLLRIAFLGMTAHMALSLPMGGTYYSRQASSEGSARLTIFQLREIAQAKRELNKYRRLQQLIEDNKGATLGIDRRGEHVLCTGRPLDITQTCSANGNDSPSETPKKRLCDTRKSVLSELEDVDNLCGVKPENYRQECLEKLGRQARARLDVVEEACEQTRALMEQCRNAKEEQNKAASQRIAEYRTSTSISMFDLTGKIETVERHIHDLVERPIHPSNDPRYSGRYLT